MKDITQDMKRAVKRRRSLLIVTPILFVIAAAVAIYFIEPKFESSTTLLIQKDDSLNPVVLYDMGVETESDDPLQSLNDIMYSRSTIDMLIDSLDLDTELESKVEKQRLIEWTQNNIATEPKATDSFEIRFVSTDPEKARAGAELLTNHVIDTKHRLAVRRHEETVNFFTTKLEEIEAIVDQQRDQTVTSTSERLRNLPSNSEALQSRLQRIDEELDTIELRLIQEEEKLAILNAFQGEPNINDGIRHLYRLPLSDTQFGEELSELLNEYETLQQQFTESYPRVRALAEQVKQVANRIPATLQSTIRRLSSQKNDLAQQKEQVIDNMQQFFVANQRATSQQSDFSIFEGLQGDMRLKLEQAKVNRDLGRQIENQFIILDAATVPEEPVSPNKPLILGIALFIGLVMGVVASSAAEMMDTTLRDEEDIPYEKPIIAYLS
ncbi:MAG: GNVR domain-containing protein [Balneolaceae bacterium]